MLASSQVWETQQYSPISFLVKGFEGTITQLVHMKSIFNFDDPLSTPFVIYVWANSVMYNVHVNSKFVDVKFQRYVHVGANLIERFLGMCIYSTGFWNVAIVLGVLIGCSFILLSCEVSQRQACEV